MSQLNLILYDYPNSWSYITSFGGISSVEECVTVLSLFLSVFTFEHGFAVAQSEPIVKVKLVNFLGNKAEITINSYLVNEVKSENGMTTVSGTGDGHGVGMSQWGAQNMAGAGKNYQEILKYYYPGIAVTQMYEGNIQAISTVKKPGWLKEQGKWYYIQPNGTKATGWIKDASKWYYLGTNGVMLTGWQKDASKWYYLGANGAMLTGWQKVNGKWYFLNSNGSMATGWLKSNNKWYYLNSSGAMATGWITDRGKKYYLSSSGAMVQNKQYINGKWYTFHSSGYLL
ncbi:hypothetical protein AA0X95_16035 [Bacillus sp. 1P10SD]|uniref:hypothetical protein n=1 Tax=Bacillus sp. 1P10SD TaxID=3132265 RepID=UPI0039A51D5D